MRLLIINPNTSAHVTRALGEHITPMLGQCWQLDCVTARFGAAYIASEAAYAIAAHAVLDAWSCQEGAYDAILIGCFGDPGLEALRELAGCPVIGLAEAAMQEAARAGRFAIVTGGARWAPILQRRAAAAGLQDQLAGLQVLSESGAELLADPPRALDRLEAAARQVRSASGAESVIIGGAALAGMGEALARRLPFAVIDNVSAAARAIRTATSRPAAAGPDGAGYHGLSPELLARLQA
ncbi:aspartate/glutamate racemase family protein [Uliginosibacterium sp. 31-12]|uniref:aspartate/glutamate racemase family protein n=1 Tax=Uliginosibacterium sp. 31-12 TaxID=3062781 RepID=UPI0026E2F8E5|nr:aspartate/glutamate racemase family protein [Uliginosibacterium sp. 31-12]MDO6387837.1 aspartate/glutamate racemase family protein [Uliginosibacterium sp. 31-12]